MTEITKNARAHRRATRAIRAEVSIEETEAGRPEAVETTNTLDVPMHLRISRDRNAQLRNQASDGGIPTSALVRRLLRKPLRQGSDVMSQADVGNIAHRVAGEELQTH